MNTPRDKGATHPGGGVPSTMTEPLLPRPELPTGQINVLLVGNGGREHALATAIARSPRLGRLYAADVGNPGIDAIAEHIGFDPDYARPSRLKLFCDKADIGLIVIGPEDPLAVGITDAMQTPRRAVFGPVAAAARLEADKAWAKTIMRSASIPMAEGRSFQDPEAAKTYILSRDEPQVIKAAGLAKGKGVFLPDTSEDAIDAIDRIMVKRVFGDAGKTVVIEERLEGPEVSVLCLVDGRNFVILDTCQDHKRLLDNDKGPNTGGMGVFCPGGLTDPAQLETIEREILIPVVDALRRDGIEYRGVLYAGIMLTPAGPKVLEFNCRFGDPETQALIPRWQGDVLEALFATAAGRLDETDVQFSEQHACCVVIASEGYPEKPKPPVEITGLAEAESMPGVTVYHAGTRTASRGSQSGKIVTSGGRVLNVVAVGETLTQARQRAYAACSKIHFPGMQYRKDIAESAAIAADQTTAATR